MKKIIVFFLVFVFLIGSVSAAFATPWEYYGGRTYRPRRVVIVERRVYTPRYYNRGYHYRSVDPTAAAIFGATVLGLGAFSIYNRSQNEAANVDVVRERERTERLRIHAELAERTYGSEGSSSVTSNEGFVDVTGSDPTASGRTCTETELKSAKVQYGTAGTISFPGGGFCRYNLQ